METETLARLIDERHAALLRLRALAARQLEAVRLGDLTGLFQLLAEKQQTLDEVTRIEQELTPYRDEDPEARDWYSAADRQRTAARWQESRQLLAAILQDERVAELELSRRRADAAEQLRGHHLSSEARRAYLHAAADPRGSALAEG